VKVRGNKPRSRSVPEGYRDEETKEEGRRKKEEGRRLSYEVK
jgi:hypothetical protein